MKKTKKSAARRPTRSPPKKKASTPKRVAKLRSKAPPKKMAAFSAKILKEEETPVAVRSWTEAKTGSQGSQELIPKTGTVVSTGTPAPPTSAGEPRLDPLTGPAAVPRARNERFEFRESTAPKRGKKAQNPQDFGQVELRQATASGGRHLTRAKPENLQRGASRIRPLASGEETGHMGATKRERFEVPPPVQHENEGGRAGTLPTDLLDFGDVTIGQQTRSGSRTVGKLDTEKKKRSRDDE